MKDPLYTYFEGEKMGGLAFGLGGVFAIIVALCILRFAAEYKAALWPLLLIAAVELGVAVGLWVKTDAQVAKLAQQRQDNPAAFYQEEGARVDKVMRNFKIIEAVELVLFATGVVLAMKFMASPTVFAVALGLILQSSAMLVGDLLAERRGEIYRAALTERAAGPS